MKSLAGLGVVLVAALALVARQPVGASWARYADADAIYVGSGISILDGERTKYFDHPGIPLQALSALTFGTQYALHRIGGGDSGLHAYAGQTMLDLDRTRVWFRGWAILIYLLGAAASFLLVARLLRSRLLGTAAGLLWVAAPGIGAMSIQLRPDVALTALCVVLAYLIATGAERRDPGRLGLAALVLGVALTVKVHAAGMAVPLVLAAVLRAPADGWWRPLAARARETVARRRRWVAASAVAWLAAIAALNVKAFPFGPAPSQRLLVLEIVAVLVAYWGAALIAERLRAPRAVRAIVGTFPAFVLTLVAAGVALSLALVVSDAGIALQSMKVTLTGGGVNTGIPLVDRLRDAVSGVPLTHKLGYVVLALGTVAFAVRRRRFWPVAILAGAAALAAMAAGRGGGALHYEAPAFMVGGIVALWLAREVGGRFLAAAAVVAAAVLAVGAIADPPRTPEADACAASVAKARQLLQPGTVALAPRALWLPDVEYRTIVETYVSLIPPYPFAFVLSAPAALEDARTLGLTPRYAVDPSLEHAAAGEVREIGTAGRWQVRPVFRDRGCGLAAIQPA